MNEMLSSMGYLSAGAFWLPVLVWTVSAGAGLLA